MNEFMALRAKARQRRDDEIAKAHQDYAESLAKIAELEQQLLGKPDPKALELSAAVERVIPRDEPFNCDNVMASLESLDPSRCGWKRRAARYPLLAREGTAQAREASQGRRASVLHSCR